MVHCPASLNEGWTCTLSFFVAFLNIPCTSNDNNDSDKRNSERKRKWVYRKTDRNGGKNSLFFLVKRVNVSSEVLNDILRQFRKVKDIPKVVLTNVTNGV